MIVFKPKRAKRAGDAPLPAKESNIEYLLVTDKTSKILKSTTDWYEIVKQANFIRRAGGEVTIFKSTKG
jgi:hypothetical protein